MTRSLMYPNEARVSILSDKHRVAQKADNPAVWMKLQHSVIWLFLGATHHFSYLLT